MIKITIQECINSSGYTGADPGADKGRGTNRQRWVSRESQIHLSVAAFLKQQIIIS